MPLVGPYSQLTVRAIVAYCLLIGVVILSRVFTFSSAAYLPPLFMLIVPALLGTGIRVSLSPGQIGFGLLVSFVVLLPWVLFISSGRTYRFIGHAAVFYQLIMVAVPEEVFFRGFLQESLGNNLKAVIVVSLLFGLAHLPSYFIGHDAYALLTFFPSLVMGYLYMKTSNVLPPILFHLLSNVVYQGFMI